MRFLSTCTMAQELLIPRTMANDVAKHKNNATEAANQDNDCK